MSASIASSDTEFARLAEVAELRQRVSDLELVVSRLREMIPADDSVGSSRSLFREGWEKMSAEERDETIAFLEAHERRSRATRVDG